MCRGVHRSFIRAYGKYRDAICEVAFRLARRVRTLNDMSRRQGSTVRWIAAGIVALTAAGGLVVGTAGPAVADPTTLLVGVGADATQDVMNAIAVNIGGGVIGSWDAVNPLTGLAHEQIMPKPGCLMTRPNGSSEGINALRSSPPGCVDFARSSIGPGTNQSPTGTLIWLPFAADGFTVATGPAMAVTGADPAAATNIRDADQFSATDLQTMYQTCNAVTPAGSTVQYVPDGTVTDATHQPIHLYVPQAGSGTRNYWASVLNFNQTVPPPCVHDVIVGTTTIVAENDGTVYAADPDALGAFSISQWVAQRNGHNDRRHNAVIHDINGTMPLTASGTLNPAFPSSFLRELFTVVKYARIISTDPGDRQFVAIFSGAGSAMCANALLLLSYGLGLLSNAPLGHQCGQVDNALRGN
jgi:phosphate transport system substrate-binding protein